VIPAIARGIPRRVAGENEIGSPPYAIRLSGEYRPEEGGSSLQNEKSEKGGRPRKPMHTTNQLYKVAKNRGRIGLKTARNLL
jgi:hypothetical protein